MLKIKGLRYLRVLTKFAFSQLENYIEIDIDDIRE